METFRVLSAAAFTLDLNSADLPNYANAEQGAAPLESIVDLSSLVSEAQVSIEIAWSEWLGRLFVAKYSVAINGIHFATLICDDQRGGEVEIETLATRHPIVLSDVAANGEDQNPSLLDALSDQTATSSDPDKPRIGVRGQADALPSWGSILDLQLRTLDAPPTPSQQRLFEEREQYEQKLLQYEIDRGIQQRTLQILSQLIVGPGEAFAESLRQFRYVGPLRRTPPRNFMAPRFPDASRWANGLAAWDRLSFDAELIELINSWLADEDRLDAGFYLKLRTLRLLDEESALFGMLASGRAFDELEDIGAEFAVCRPEGS